MRYFQIGILSFLYHRGHRYKCKSAIKESNHLLEMSGMTHILSESKHQRHDLVAL